MAPKKKSESAAVAAVAKQNNLMKMAVKDAEAVVVTAETKTKKGSKKVSFTTTTDDDEDVEEADEKAKVKETKTIKEKRAPTKYQLFFKQKLAELREEYDDPETRPSYADMRTMINEEWHTDNPKPEKTTSVPREKKERKPKNTDSKEKTKRAPTAYNIFIARIMTQLKNEHENDVPKLNQKDIMKLAAVKWNEHKATLVTTTVNTV